MRTRKSKSASRAESAPSADRRLLLAVLALTVPLGFASKYAPLPGAAWASAHGAGFFYEIFWILMIGLAAPRTRPRHAAAGVFIATSLLECLQLVESPVLAAMRGTEAGRILIGESFSAADFPFYAAGCLAGAGLLAAAAARKRPSAG